MQLGARVVFRMLWGGSGGQLSGVRAHAARGEAKGGHLQEEPPVVLSAGVHVNMPVQWR